MGAGLLDIPPELHKQIAGWVPAEEQRNVLHGITLACKETYLQYNSYLYENVYLGNRRNPFAVHQFLVTIENNPELKKHIKTVDVDVETNVDPTPIAGWTRAVASAAAGFGSELMHWRHMLPKGDLTPAIGLLMLRLPELEEFSLSTTSDSRNHYLGFYDIFADEADESYHSVISRLPRVQRLKSREMLHPVQSLLNAKQATFSTPVHRYDPSLCYPAAAISDSHCTFQTITSLSINTDIRISDMDERPPACAMSEQLRSTLVHFQNLDKLDFNIATYPSQYAHNIIIHMQKLIIRFIGRNLSALSQFSIRTQDVPLEISDQVLPLISLHRFREIYHLITPQAALTYMTVGIPHNDELFLDILGPVRVLEIVDADQSCHRIAMSIVGWLGRLRQLGEVKVCYKNQQCFTRDNHPAWQDMEGTHINVLRCVNE